MTSERELQRLVERWQQLPLDQALSRMPVVRPVIQELADAVADVEGRPHVLVPDLGPRAVMDQLTVTAYDASPRGRCPLDVVRRVEPQLRRS